MSSREFAEWKAFSLIAPIGEVRADYRSALICSVLANIHRNTETQKEPFTPDDFLPQFKVEQWEEEQELEYTSQHTPEDLWLKLKNWAILAGGKPNVSTDQVTRSPGP